MSFVMYKNLEDTKVLRRAAMSDNRLRYAASTCQIGDNELENKHHLQIKFRIGSKGGKTDLYLRIGEGDFPMLLEEIVDTKAGATALKKLVSKMITKATKEK